MLTKNLEFFQRFSTLQRAGRGQCYVRYAHHDGAAKCLDANPSAAAEEHDVPWSIKGE